MDPSNGIATSGFSLAQRHWKILLFGFLVNFSSVIGQTVFFSLFNRQIRADFGLSHGDFGFVYLLATVTSGVVIVYTGTLIDHIRLRVWTLFITTVLVAAGLFFALNHSIWLLVPGIFVLRHFGQGLMSHTASTSMGRYFSRFRGRALALASFGYPFAEFVMPFLIALLLGFMHWRSVYIIVTLMIACLMIPAAFLLLKARGNYGELADEEDGASTVVLRGLTRKQTLRTTAFWYFVPLVFTPSFLGTGWIFHHQHLADERSWPVLAVPFIFSIVAVATVASAMLFGMLNDRYSARKLIAVPMSLLLLAQFVFAIPLDSMWVGYLAFLVAGFANGSVAVVMNAAWAEYFGVKHLGAIKALSTMLVVGGSAFAPFVMGLQFDLGSSISAVALVNAAIAATALMCGFKLQRMAAPLDEIDSARA